MSKFSVLEKVTWHYSKCLQWYLLIYSIFNFSERVASSRITLKEDEISKVTDIINADNRLRFSVEYLGIDGNEYRIIESDAKYNHHDTLHECIRRWRNRTEAEGVNPRDKLIKILTEIRQTRGWFPFDVMSFLTDVTGMEISEPSKGPHVHTHCSWKPTSHYFLLQSQVSPRRKFTLSLSQVLKTEGGQAKGKGFHLALTEYWVFAMGETVCIIVLNMCFYSH